MNPKKYLIFLPIFAMIIFTPFIMKKMKKETPELLESKSFIKNIKSFNEVDFEKDFEIGDLVLFDVDHTLLKPIDLYGQYMLSNDPKCIKKISDLKEVYADQFDAYYFLGLMMKGLKVELIEPEIISKIKYLQEQKKLQLIAITGMPTGFNLGLGDSWQHWRFKKLKNIGFEGSFSKIAFVLNNSEYTRPIFYKGIIFTDYEDKGKSLEYFLKKIDKIGGDSQNELNFLDMSKEEIKNLQKTNFKQVIKRIVMFDDSDKYLESVWKFCKKAGLEFHGYHYKPYEILDWESHHDEVFKVQASNAMEKNIWIFDEDALRDLEEKK